MKQVTRTSGALVAALAIATGSAASQPTRTLGAPEFTFDADFSAVSGFRALRDGRIIVVDGRERTIRILDPRDGSATAVGREGAGPGEYGGFGRLHPLAGDTTIMYDFVNSRYFVIRPDGKPGDTFRLPIEESERLGNLLGVDGRGRMVFDRTRRAPDALPMSGSSGIVDLLRVDRRTQRLDTLAQLMRPVGEQSGARQLEGGLLQMFTNRPLAPVDLAVVAADGRVVIARGTNYRIDVVGADGRLREGTTIPLRPIRVTRQEQEAWVKATVRPGSIIVRGPVGGTAAPMPRAGGARNLDAIDAGSLLSNDMTWPENLPPFLQGAMLAAPDGRAWVLRTRAHDDPVPRYDVFDAAGNLVERVALPATTRLVGFGEGVVYLSRPDADDLLRIERHRLP